MKPRPTLIPARALLAVAARMTAGAARHDQDGSPGWRASTEAAYLDKVGRHYLARLAGGGVEELAALAADALIALELALARQDLAAGRCPRCSWAPAASSPAGRTQELLEHLDEVHPKGKTRSAAAPDIVPSDMWTGPSSRGALHVEGR